MKDSVLVKECLLDLNKPRTEQTEGSTEKKKKGFVCDHFLLYDVIFSNFKNNMVFGCPLSEMSEVLFTKDLKSGECNLLISTVRTPYMYINCPRYKRKLTQYPDYNFGVPEGYTKS